jgi:aminoglycoside phosphotransferase (APT) family kinase protein
MQPFRRSTVFSSERINAAHVPCEDSGGESAHGVPACQNGLSRTLFGERRNRVTETPESAPFTEESARAVLAAALPDATATAELLALGENAVFAVGARSPGCEAPGGGAPGGGEAPGAGGPYGDQGSAGLVVKVGRDRSLLPRAAHEVRVARWLAAHGVPAVRAAAPDARLVAGHPVTVWHRLPPAPRPAGGADLAALLRLVHALPEPPFALPRRDPLDGVERWLRLAGDAVDPADAAWLRGLAAERRAAAAELRPHLPPGPLHGDALPRNVHVDPAGRPVLLDLETFGTGPREHDLVVMVLAADRYGLPAAEYAAFAAAYGWDVREWAGCAVLRGVREAASCAWVAQRAPGNPAARREFAHRVATLRAGCTGARWHTF